MSTLDKRRKSQIEKDRIIEIACHQLLDDNSNITARAVATKVGIATSSITRDKVRLTIIKEVKIKQDKLHQWKKRQDKISRNKDAEILAQKDKRIYELEQQVKYLQASHKAMILSIGELGGASMYNNLFKKWKLSEKILLENGDITTYRV